jgi:hypothetical protein
MHVVAADVFDVDVEHFATEHKRHAAAVNARNVAR